MINSGIRWTLVACPIVVATLLADHARGDSFSFTVNASSDHEYGHQLALPTGFGEGAFTLEFWILPDASFPVGPTGGGTEQLVNWSDADEEPYSSGSWWYEGNFLLDGHNNGSFKDGTFSVQFYGGGRVRWLFGDGVVAGPGGHWSVGAYPAEDTAPLLDDAWHHVALVRRAAAGTGADLELWIDGALVATEHTPLMVNMRQWWDTWTGFPGPQAGWFWGAEKQAAIGILSQYEDYKGRLDEVRYWSVARTPQSLTANYDLAVIGNETGLVGHYRLDDGTGTTTCDELGASACITLINTDPTIWSAQDPPLRQPGDVDGDGNVGFADILDVIANWGPCSGCRADADSSGNVGFDDILFVLSNWIGAFDHTHRIARGGIATEQCTTDVNGDDTTDFRRPARAPGRLGAVLIAPPCSQ